MQGADRLRERWIRRADRLSERWIQGADRVRGGFRGQTDKSERWIQGGRQTE